MVVLVKIIDIIHDLAQYGRLDKIKLMREFVWVLFFIAYF